MEKARQCECKYLEGCYRNLMANVRCNAHMGREGYVRGTESYIVEVELCSKVPRENRLWSSIKNDAL